MMCVYLPSNYSTLVLHAKVIPSSGIDGKAGDGKMECEEKLRELINPSFPRLFYCCYYSHGQIIWRLYCCAMEINQKSGQSLLK